MYGQGTFALLCFLQNNICLLLNFPCLLVENVQLLCLTSSFANNFFARKGLLLCELCPANVLFLLLRFCVLKVRPFSRRGWIMSLILTQVSPCSRFDMFTKEEFDLRLQIKIILSWVRKSCENIIYNNRNVLFSVSKYFDPRVTETDKAEWINTGGAQQSWNA